MRISAKAEYACVAMLDLAANYAGPQPVRVKAIADAHGISQRFLVQILLQLKSKGLVTSVRGASGGYQLTRPPDNISLWDIIQAIEDRTLTPRSALDHVKAVDVLLGVWREIHAEEQRMLEKLTLAELVRRRERGNALSYQI